jgi:hypothetical protein
MKIKKTAKDLIQENIEKTLNQEILTITQKIKDHHPELNKYLEEIPITIPFEKNPEISNKILKAYLNTLIDILEKYELEHPDELIY